MSFRPMRGPRNRCAGAVNDRASEVHHTIGVLRVGAESYARDAASNVHHVQARAGSSCNVTVDSERNRDIIRSELLVHSEYRHLHIPA